MTENNKFTVTGDHLLLMKELEVEWNDAEFGAPTINPKRPYGNSNVCKDMLKILDWEITVSINDGPGEPFDIDDDGLPDTLEETLEELHAELETALQICLSTGSFEAGTYQLNEHDKWRKCNGQEN